MYFNQNVTTQNNIHGYNDIMIIDNEHNDNQVCYQNKKLSIRSDKLQFFKDDYSRKTCRGIATPSSCRIKLSSPLQTAMTPRQQHKKQIQHGIVGNGAYDTVTQNATRQQSSNPRRHATIIAS